jgi:hypothetical protein
LAAGIGAAMGVTVLFTFNIGSRVVAAGFRVWERFKTWQAASPEQRQRIREEDQRLGDDRFDLWDLRSEK